MQSTAVLHVRSAVTAVLHLIVAGQAGPAGLRMRVCAAHAAAAAAVAAAAIIADVADDATVVSADAAVSDADAAAALQAVAMQSLPWPTRWSCGGAKGWSHGLQELPQLKC